MVGILLVFLTMSSHALDKQPSVQQHVLNFFMTIKKTGLPHKVTFGAIEPENEKIFTILYDRLTTPEAQKILEMVKVEKVGTEKLLFSYQGSRVLFGGYDVKKGAFQLNGKWIRFRNLKNIEEFDQQFKSDQGLLLNLILPRAQAFDFLGPLIGSVLGPLGFECTPGSLWHNLGGSCEGVNDKSRTCQIVIRTCLNKNIDSYLSCRRKFRELNFNAKFDRKEFDECTESSLDDRNYRSYQGGRY